MLSDCSFAHPVQTKSTVKLQDRLVFLLSLQENNSALNRDHLMSSNSLKMLTVPRLHAMSFDRASVDFSYRVVPDLELAAIWR